MVSGVVSGVGGGGCAGSGAGGGVVLVLVLVLAVMLTVLAVMLAVLVLVHTTHTRAHHHTRARATGDPFTLSLRGDPTTASYLQGHVHELVASTREKERERYIASLLHRLVS